MKWNKMTDWYGKWWITLKSIRVLGLFIFFQSRIPCCEYLNGNVQSFLRFVVFDKQNPLLFVSLSSRSLPLCNDIYWDMFPISSTFFFFDDMPRPLLPYSHYRLLLPTPTTDYHPPHCHPTPTPPPSRRVLFSFLCWKGGRGSAELVGSRTTSLVWGAEHWS